MMAEDIKPEVLKKTQTALNKYIKKPPLTEKLLKKPPFRFLHDIVTSVIKETGYLNGVFTAEELNADNVKDKDSKIKFLTKLISAVKDSTGNNLKAKPGKIVAGLEVDKTLELLQAIAKGIASQNGNKSVISSQGDSKPLKDVPGSFDINNKSKPKAEENTSQKSSDVKDKKKREKKKDDTKVGNTNEEKQKKKSKPERKENGEKLGKREKAQNEEPLGKKEKSNEEKSSKNGKTDNQEKQILKEVKRRESFTSEENNSTSATEVEKSETQNNIENNLPDTVKETEKINNEEVSQTGGISKQSSVESKTEEANADKKEEEIVFRHKEPEHKNQKQNNEVDNHKQSNGEITLKRPSTRRSSSRSLKQPMKVISEKGDPGKDKEDSKIIEDTNVSNISDKKKIKNEVKDFNTPEADTRPPSAIERPRTARRAPPTARPPSARPGAPKTRDRGEVAVDLNKEKENEAKEVIVIAENEKVEEDKENMVVVEPHHMVLDEENNVEDVNSSGAEGVLVDILESANGIEKQKQKPQKTEIEWEGGQKDKRATWQKECDQLKAGIQALTRSTGPLGKLFDFLQEDVDLAARELSYWKQASAEYTTQLQSEKRMTEELLSKHKKKLTELEGLIEEEQEAIRAVKSSILINERKILSLISRVPTTQ